MNYLTSNSFNSQTMMGTLPIQHYISQALDMHAKKERLIVQGKDPKPLHHNFL